MKIRIFLFSFVFVELGHRRFAFAGVLYPKDNISKSSEFDDLQSSENESGSKSEISENVKGKLELALVREVFHVFYYIQVK